MMITYSGNMEDVILCRVFRDIERGFYVDVGSHTAIDTSNTYALYCRGWSGVACDPIYHFEQSWASEWKRWRPRDVLVRDLIGEKESGEHEYFLCNYRGLSTGARKIINSHKDLNKAHVTEKGSMVPTTTLTRILDRTLNGSALHLICIDVEGMEESVLRGLDFAKYRPWVFVIEAVYSADFQPAYQVWEPLLEEQGYDCVYDDRLNRFYLHRDHADLGSRFRHPPNITDEFKTFREWELERRLAELEYSRPILEK